MPASTDKREQKEEEDNNDNNNGLFILNNLPKESSFGLDSNLWIVDKFNGVKNIPPGIHLFTFTASPNTSNSKDKEILSNGIEIKQGLFKFFSNNDSKKNEIFIEEWDNLLEELLSDSKKEILKIKRNRNFQHVHKINKNNKVEVEVEEIIISKDYLNSIDKFLAFYPSTLENEWLNLSNFLTLRTIYRVIGFDFNLNARVNSSMSTNQDNFDLSSSSKSSVVDGSSNKTSWGKERLVKVEMNEDDDDDDVEKEEREKEIIKEEVLEFLIIESKRTWPKGSFGSELTQWSKDKSWYLSNIIFNQLGKENQDIQEYLAELQLSFILFVLLHNYSSLTIYKSLFTLLCQSPSILYPINSTNNPLNPELIQKQSLPLFKSFLNLFKKQLNFLEDSFFSTELPDLETYFLDQLSCLQSNLIDAGREWELIPTLSPFSSSTTTISSSSSTTSEQQELIGPKLIWNLIILEWDGICNLSMKKFGWNLESIKLGSTRRQLERDQQLGVMNRGRDEDEVDLEDLEEGDEAPVIVEL